MFLEPWTEHEKEFPRSRPCNWHPNRVLLTAGSRRSLCGGECGKPRGEEWAPRDDF